jgi:hypothetical protein
MGTGSYPGPPAQQVGQQACLRNIVWLDAHEEGSAMEQMLRNWWARITAWLHSPERSEQAGQVKSKAKDTVRDLRDSDAGRRAESAVRDLRDSDAARKAGEAMRDLRNSETARNLESAAKDFGRDLRDGEVGRKAKDALRDLRDSDAGRKARDALRELGKPRD